MPSTAVGKLIRRGRPRGVPTAVRSVRLPVSTWKRLESEARAQNTSINALIARRVG
jgi:predicted DNA-binding ribbon-helix-helix protein